ncbi:MAG TPA: FkbM family methyltransferase [Nocardioidaceae bacterium]|nr:FkbM family methyltransferase [Nocardioidaceae bacterium]
MTVAHRARRARHAARRVRQTVTDFDNGAALLTGMARGRLAGTPDELTFRVDGLAVTVPNRKGARVPVYEVFAEDAYRLGWFLSGLGDAPVVVDIGGHVGCFSLAVASRLPGARVSAYEASPSTAAYLERNVAANALTGRISTHATAVGPTAGFLEFADNDGGSALNGLTSPQGSTVIKVPCVTVAEAFDAAGGPDLVKIDTEGAEYALVLASAPETWAAVRRVVLEYHDVPQHSWGELETFFARAGLHQVAHLPENSRQGTVWLSRDDLPASA